GPRESGIHKSEKFPHLTSKVHFSRHHQCPRPLYGPHHVVQLGVAFGALTKPVCFPSITEAPSEVSITILCMSGPCLESN
ncbi:unnamed protein product, partial [Tetraodon nigroviridis]